MICSKCGHEIPGTPVLEHLDIKGLCMVCALQCLDDKCDMLAKKVKALEDKAAPAPAQKPDCKRTDFRKMMYEMIDKYRKEHPTLPPQWGKAVVTEAMKKAREKFDKEFPSTCVPWGEGDVITYSISDPAPKCVSWAHCDGEKICLHGGTVIVDKEEWDKLQADNAALKAKLDTAPKCPHWGFCDEKGLGCVVLRAQEYDKLQDEIARLKAKLLEHERMYSTYSHKWDEATAWLRERDTVMADKTRLKAELAEAAKKHRIEWWWANSWVHVRVDGGAPMCHHMCDIDEAIGTVVWRMRGTLNLDIVPLPAPPEEEKKP